MAYLNTIPQPTDQESQSQAQLLNNFDAINTFVNVNHVAFNGADQGKHKFITLPQQAVVPPGIGAYPPTMSATEYGIYNKTNGANPAIFVRKPGAPAGDVSGDVDITTLTYNAGTYEGSVTLPCGLIMKWGFSDAGGGVSDRDIIFATAFPTNTINIQATPHSPGVGNHGFDLYVTYINRTHFTLHWHHTFAAYWFALGY